MSDPPLSIVIATTQPWPELRMTLDSLYEQARACGAEIVIGDATGQGLPDDVDARYPGLVVVPMLGRSVFALRRAAIARARADLVATTEDHCSVPPDWCARILDAFVRHPQAAVIGGGVANGCPAMLRDWAHHFLVFGPSVPPIDPNHGRPIWAASNIIYRREAVFSTGDGPAPVDLFTFRDLSARGMVMVADPALVVSHHQSFPVATFCGYHFHNGRAIAGARLARIGWPERVARAAACAILPLYLVALRSSDIWPKRALRTKLVLGLPWLAVYSMAHSAGELLGYLAGPGTSPERLR